MIELSTNDLLEEIYYIYTSAALNVLQAQYTAALTTIDALRADIEEEKKRKERSELRVEELQGEISHLNRRYSCIFVYTYHFTNSNVQEVINSFNHISRNVITSH